jgi:hypothetical protein
MQLSIVGTAMGNICAGLLLAIAVVYRRAADKGDPTHIDAHLRYVERVCQRHTRSTQPAPHAPTPCACAQACTARRDLRV